MGLQIPDYNASTRQITQAVMGVLGQKMANEQADKRMRSEERMAERGWEAQREVAEWSSTQADRRAEAQQANALANMVANWKHQSDLQKSARDGSKEDYTWMQEQKVLEQTARRKREEEIFMGYLKQANVTPQDLSGENNTSAGAHFGSRVALGAGTGATMGAVGGSFVPGVGTALGAGVGGAVGAGAGAIEGIISALFGKSKSELSQEKLDKVMNLVNLMQTYGNPQNPQAMLDGLQ